MRTFNRKYGNAIQDDLWEFFSEQAKVNKVLLPASVKELMDSWTLKMGIAYTYIHSVGLAVRILS